MESDEDTSETCPVFSFGFLKPIWKGVSVGGLKIVGLNEDWLAAGSDGFDEAAALPGFGV